MEEDIKITHIVEDVVAQALGLERSDINKDSSFTCDLKADSLDMAEIVMDLEELFGIYMSEGDCDVDTVGKLVESVKRRVNAKPKRRKRKMKWRW